VLARVLLTPVEVHVLAALWHQLVRRDRAVSRMMRG
jgi:cytochrome b561